MLKCSEHKKEIIYQSKHGVVYCEECLSELIESVPPIIF